MITLDQLKRHGRALANRCCLYEEDEKTIPFVNSLQDSQDALGPFFNDSWDKLGLSALSPSNPSSMARSAYE